jgi:ribosomal protein S18 acetylase RimI-like enzyme
MAARLTVRRLREDEWQAFRSLRLAALRTDPLAFGSTLDRESAYTEEKWRDWCREGATGDRNATFVAVDPSGELLGMVGTFSVEGTPHVWGMWTRPKRRNQGIGRQLMVDLLDWIGQKAPGCPIILDVNPGQAAAVRIYTASGFEFNGIEKPLGHDPPALARQMIRRPSSER